MTNQTITPEILLAVANEVEKRPEYAWVLHNGVVCIMSWKNKPVEWYEPEHDKAQQLRIADYLAEKCAYVVKEGDNYIAKKYWGGDRIATSKQINLCRALAVLALIEGED